MYRVVCLAVATEALEPKMQEAYRTSRRSLAHHPFPVWLSKDAERGRIRPHGKLVSFLNARVEAGAPLEDVLAPLHELEAHYTALFPCDLPPLAECQVRETVAQGTADRAQMLLAQSVGPAELERAEECVREHVREDQVLLLRIQYDRRERSLLGGTAMRRLTDDRGAA